jgi:transcriptional regulator with XRE-family HTH domain
MSKQMAEFLNIVPRNYQRYETGDVDPPTSKTIALADYFNVSLDYLVGRSDDPARY